MYVNGDNVTCFKGFVIEYIPKEIKRLIGRKNIATKTKNTSK